MRPRANPSPRCSGLAFSTGPGGLEGLAAGVPCLGVWRETRSGAITNIHLALALCPVLYGHGLTCCTTLSNRIVLSFFHRPGKE